MLQIILVASGGATGALLRFSLSGLIKIYFYNSFIATLFINIIGSFLIGYIISLSGIKNLPENFIRYFLIIGFLGSFTTFSTFSYEVLDLIYSKKFSTSIIYIISSVILCIFSAFVGMYINKI